MENIARISKPGGTICVIAPYSWGYHAHPIDCWRIYPDGMDAVMKHAGLEVVTTYMVPYNAQDGSGDTIGIARRP